MTRRISRLPYPSREDRRQGGAVTLTAGPTVDNRSPDAVATYQDQAPVAVVSVSGPADPWFRPPPQSAIRGEYVSHVTWACTEHLSNYILTFEPVVSKLFSSYTCSRILHSQGHSSALRCQLQLLTLRSPSHLVIVYQAVALVVAISRRKPHVKGKPFEYIMLVFVLTTCSLLR